MSGHLEDEELPYEEEPKPWRAPVVCPRCHGTNTQFVSLRYEDSVYACELCGIEFEVEE